MPKRVQSPSSINCYKQCPRKYYYQYIVKHPTGENIHCIRGNVVHSALESFFSIDVNSINPVYYKKELSLQMKSYFDKHWDDAWVRLQKTGLNSDKLDFYYTESTHMLANFLNSFFSDMDKKTMKLDFVEAFNKLKPTAMEQEYRDEKIAVRGFIDVIKIDGNKVTLIDYKTSKSSKIRPEYKLQMGIYSLLYYKKNGVVPDTVGLWFVKDKLVEMDVTPELIRKAEFEIEQIHASTETSHVLDYPKKITPLCKYSTGQCDFYDICQKDRN